VRFKSDLLQLELLHSPAKLIEVANHFSKLSAEYGIEAFVTRVWGKIENDSGVHANRRAIDFRSQYYDAKGRMRWLYTVDVVDDLVRKMNAAYPRPDKYKTCIHHSFQGKPFHFHVQIPAAWVTKGETNGSR
jgi:hypothetical protein